MNFDEVKMITIIDAVRKELKQNADPAIAESSRRFFKEPIRCYGMKTALGTQIAKKYFKQIQTEDKKVIFDLCDQLWQSGYMEESFIACNWSFALRKKFAPADFKTFETWIGKYVSNWASCDTFCNHTVGSFVETFPDFIAHLKKWTRSKNRWLKRAAAVTLILPARHGLFLNDIFEIADALLTDEDDLVQKGYGWLLKAASAPHQKEVFNYVMKNKKAMPRTALRYAIEKLPDTLRKQAMSK
jgi:3-methyladenine DNA glycosylase AlkD